MQVNLNKIKNYKYFLIDLDNTLYKRYDNCHNYALKEVYRKFKKDLKCSSLTEFINEYQRSQKNVKKHTRDQASSHSRLLYFQDLFERIYDRTRYRLTIRAEQYYWENFFVKMNLDKKIISRLRESKKNSAKICIITNLNTRIQFKKIIILRLDKLIDFIVSSEEAGREKPDTAIFLQAMKKLGANKKEALIIGDSLKDDIEPAKKLGLDYIHIK